MGVLIVASALDLDFWGHSCTTIRPSTVRLLGKMQKIYDYRLISRSNLLSGRKQATQRRIIYGENK